MRPGIEVRPAEPADLDDLVALCLTARAESSVGPQVCTADGSTLAHQIGALAAAPGGSVLVATADGATVGLLLGRLLGPSPFTDEVSLAVEALYVVPGHRRRGVGHALMTGAADLAAAAHAAHVYAAPIPGARGMQRFFVQLGFAPAAAHRVTSTSALQRRLAVDGGAARRPAPRGLEDLIARRRQSRDSSGLDRLVGAPVALTVETPKADQIGRRSSITRHVRRAVQMRLDVESSTTIS
ncbi:GNAT family N-acetyltransferase [Actinotalea subterranea]|uniref:GNAT family N-acetyltransferase n=1 Tax=Actinotalea subterranea TaxID=2607497 RepID=UPI0011ED978C|nr:GNAT family N-acetyltransferase [Actinotalea subterranea]